MPWKDNFSTQAVDYAKYRPHYPPALYDYLFSLVKEKRVAWDCGTGNGQVATALAKVFHQVIATDPSSTQLAQAPVLPNVTYQVATAEHTQLPAASVNLITVAQAIHWFNVETFYQEVQRVAVPGKAIIAVWGYGLLQISPTIDNILQQLYVDILGPYWDAERRHLDQAYRTIPFPFPPFKTPPLTMQLEWNLKDLLGYLSTWSSLQKFIRTNHYDPLPEIAKALQTIWSKEAVLKTVQWELYLKVGWI